MPTLNKIPVGETGSLCIFCLDHCLVSPALHPGFSDLGGSPPALSSTPTLVFLCFLNALASSFLIHSHVTYGTPCHARGHLHSLTCDLPDAMPRQRSLILILREAEDFPRGDKHFKHVPPPTYLIYLSPKDLYR